MCRCTHIGEEKHSQVKKNSQVKKEGATHLATTFKIEFSKTLTRIARKRAFLEESPR